MVRVALRYMHTTKTIKMIKLFGTTVNETINTLGGRVHLGGKQTTKEDRTKVIGRIIVTCLLIIVAVYLFFIGNKDVGGTIIGAIVGYWMK